MDEKVRQRQALFELREKTLGQILDETVARIPDKEAIVYADRNYRQTWREFADTVDLFAKGLMALGVQKGEKVAVWASNVPYWVTLQFATAKIGAILITVNTNYREHELEYLLLRNLRSDHSRELGLDFRPNQQSASESGLLHGCSEE